jgi:hypothetical protein
MARIWKEKIDTEKYLDFRSGHQRGGQMRTVPQDASGNRWVYFVRVCSFTFQFVELNHIREYLNYFSQKPLPSSGKRGGKALEPYWRAWHERIPMWLKEEPKRQKIVKALQRALEVFEKSE